MAEADRLVGNVTADQMVKKVEDLPVWSRRDVLRRNGELVIEGEEKRRRVLLLVEGCIVDVGGYLEDHVSFCDSWLPSLLYDGVRLDDS
jgi:stearoyl-CoA desaturase (delta-9 desaturase)